MCPKRLLWLPLLIASITAPALATPRVIIISLDGMRPDAISPDNAPTLTAVIAGGAYHNACINELPPITLPNHSSMVTGLCVPRHGVVLNTDLPGNILSPTLFDLAKAAGKRVGFYVSKSKLGFLCRTESADERLISPGIDAMIAAIGTAIETNTDLIFVHFADPDSTGHRKGWMSPDYIDAVRRVDGLVGQIVAALDRTGARAETTLLITADHGGIGDNHWLDVPVVRHIPFIVNGPGVVAGLKLNATRSVVDVAATAAKVLGITMPNIDGIPADEAWGSTSDAESVRPPAAVAGCGATGWLALLGLAAGLVLMRKFLPWRQPRA